MAKIAKNILTLDHEEAMDFFMKSGQYHGFELPEYFTFDEVLKYVREVCSEENWTQVKTLFDKFKVPHITSCAIPIIPREKEAFNIPYNSVVDGETLKKVTPVITFRETRMYNETY